MTMNETIEQHENDSCQREPLSSQVSLPRYVLVVISVITVLLAIASQPARSVYAATKTVVVTMTDKPPTYVPAKLTVKVGTTVLWKNTGATLHDVTTNADMAQNKADVALPVGAKPFDSGFMPPGTTWSYTFTVPGRYVYACIPHEKDRMIGEVTVTK